MTYPLAVLLVVSVFGAAWLALWCLGGVLAWLAGDDGDGE